jgi:hypothetical protein
MRYLLILLLALACGSTSAPKVPTVDALNLASSAVVVTDAACAVAIAAQPAGADMSKFVVYVQWLKSATAAIEDKGDVCGRLPTLQIIADSVKCTTCTSTIELAERALGCPR